MEKRRLFTSESVSMGHPDKVSDQISDAILDAILAQDPDARVACETLVCTDYVMVAGEITTTAKIDTKELVKQTIREIGYTDDAIGFNADTCQIDVRLNKQSPDISQGVTANDTKEQGAGDQGMMFGYACNESPELMPLPVMLSHRLLNQLAKVRQNKGLSYLRPDSKSQVTVEYEGNTPVRVHTVVISTQHNPDVTHETIKKDMIALAKQVIPSDLLDDKTIYHINPTGRFVVGGPHGDTGLTGRKIIVDTYGGMGRHGGGAFSGKDPSKVDRSASYAARYVAKNIVASGIADRCEVQLSYAIGVAEPLSINVNTEGTGKIAEDKIVGLIRKHFRVTPRGIIESLNLKRPIYKDTARYGHFGRTDKNITWEKTDKADVLRRDAGLQKKNETCLVSS